MYRNREFNENLNQAGLINLKNVNLGFGPFTFFNHNIFSDDLAVRIHLKLQRHADQGFPILRSTGSQYLVLAKRMMLLSSG